MTNNSKLGRFQEIKIWRFIYRGILVEINHWKSQSFSHDSKSYWTYYVFLNLYQLTDKKLAKQLWIVAKPINEKGEKWEQKKYYRYSQIPFLTSIDFHYGITWYSKLFSSDDEKMIKIGCDYDHADENPDYETVESVTNDVINTIDSIHNSIEYLLMCNGNGQLVKESDGIYYKNWFYSLEYAKNTEWYVNYLIETEKP